jgi:hypothetical protein
MDSPSASLFPLTRPVVLTSTVRQLLQSEEPASLRAPLTELLLRRPGTGRILHQFPGRWHRRAQRAALASSFIELRPEHTSNAAATLGLLLFHRPSGSDWTSYSGYFGQIGRPDRNHNARPRWLCGLSPQRRYDDKRRRPALQITNDRTHRARSHTQACGSVGLSGPERTLSQPPESFSQKLARARNSTHHGKINVDTGFLMSLNIIRLGALAALALLPASPAAAQNQVFPGAPQSTYVFNPLAGAQPVATRPASPAVQPPGGVWQVPSRPAVLSPRFLPGQFPDQAAPWVRPPVGPIPGQFVPDQLVPGRQIATSQPAAQLHSAKPNAALPGQSTPQPHVMPWQMSPPARRFWHDLGGYGGSTYGQSQPGFSKFGQNHFNQSASGYSRHNQSDAGQSYSQPSFHNQNHFHQSLPNTTLHNVVIPYGRNWR